MKKVIVGDMSRLPGMSKELYRQIGDGCISLEHLQMFLDHKDPFVADDVTSLLYEWNKFYQEEFGLDVKWPNDEFVRVPERKSGFNRLIVVAKGLTIQQVYDKCSQNFECWKYADDNLDKAVPTNDRATDKSYAIWIRDRVEADEELKNLSADDLKKKNIQGITLLERLILELKYFKETGKHLDIDNVTLCSGSRDSDGNVPSVYWYSLYGKLHVHWDYADDASDNLRSRQAVS